MRKLTDLFNWLFGDIGWKMFMALLIVALCINLGLGACGVGRFPCFAITVFALLIIMHEWENGDIPMLMRRIKLRLARRRDKK